MLEKQSIMKEGQPNNMENLPNNFEQREKEIDNLIEELAEREGM